VTALADLFDQSRNEAIGSICAIDIVLDLALTASTAVRYRDNWITRNHFNLGAILIVVSEQVIWRLLTKRVLLEQVTIAVRRLYRLIFDESNRGTRRSAAVSIDTLMI
jgi:hypothetical protein